jgi:hypothetical protein
MKTFHYLSGKISVAYEEKLSDPIDEKMLAGNHTVIISCNHCWLQQWFG